jgi:two-component system response regulator QseB
VDDDDAIRRLISRILEPLDVEVEEAVDGRDGLRRAIEGSHDVILLDLHLPHVDGHEVLRRLRAIEAHVPVIVLSCAVDPDVARSCRDAGADDVLSKPFDVGELAARVSTACAHAVGRA